MKKDSFNDSVVGEGLPTRGRYPSVDAGTGKSGMGSYYITAADLAQRGKDRIPEEMVSGKHLIYSSPATLAFNSPGAKGFGVKRAALAIPGSVMLLVAPGCCGRNTTIYSEIPGYENRFFYLLMDETDVVTGRHLKKIPKAVCQIVESLQDKPSVVMICITCVDALLGTDMERVCRKASDQAGLPVLPSYMYALTREGRKPPMVHVRQSIYSLLERRRRKSSSVNLLGYFAPLAEDCELYDLLAGAGVKTIREIGRCRDFDEYMAMSEANFNLVLNPEARYAASDLQKRLGIPFVELTRLYRIEKIRKQYRLFGAALDIQIDDFEYYKEAEETIRSFRQDYPGLTFSIGEGCNANAFDLALALLEYGFSVAEVFADPSAGDFRTIENIARLSPDTRMYSNLEPTMLYYDCGGLLTDLTVGRDAAFYHPQLPNLSWSEDVQPFGYHGLIRFFKGCRAVLEGRPDLAPEEKAPLPDEKKKSRLLAGKPSGIKGFRKHIAPFAPDQSGAAELLCELNGMVIILDAGGCAGNICGFDEPRWFETRSAIFSAGLRDMDAILGRDERLVEKVEKACRKLDCSFIAIVGTPVPSVIATDYRALKRMLEKRTGLPVITVDTNGMDLYDAGVRKALKAVMKAFVPEKMTDKKADRPAGVGPEPVGHQERLSENKEAGVLGLLGAVPLDLTLPSGSWDLSPREKDHNDLLGDHPLKRDHSGSQENDRKKDYRSLLRDYYLKKGVRKVLCYGWGGGLDEIRQAAWADRNLVLSPAALPAARWLKDHFGTPYEAAYPLETLPGWKELEEAVPLMKGKKVLIVHQQVLAHSLREYIEGWTEASVTVASWFDLDDELVRAGDIPLRQEDQWMELMDKGGYDYVIGDPLFREAILPREGQGQGWTGVWLEIDHFAVSGRR